MKKSITPHNIDELKEFLEDNNLSGEIEQFKLTCDSPGGAAFGMQVPEVYTINVRFNCVVDDD